MLPAVVALLLASAAAAVPTSRAEFENLSAEQRRQLPLDVKLRFARPASDAIAAAPGLPVAATLPNQLQSSRPGSGQAVTRPLSAQSDPAAPRATKQWRGPDRVPGEHASAEGIDAAGGPRPEAVTRPQPLSYTFGFPHRAVTKLLMGFDGWYYACSGAMVNENFLLTAGHCLYNWDPDHDGDNADRSWADEVYAFPGQTDQIPAVGEAEHPFGEAHALTLFAYTGWTESGNIVHDVAFAHLDRPLGLATGWFGYETNAEAASLNFSGYPAEPPHVPAAELRPYPGFDEGNVASYSTLSIHLASFTYGGHSGGPAWRYDGEDRRIQGVNSTSDRAGNSTAARMTNQVFTDLQAEMAARPPGTALADLGEWTRWTLDPTKLLHTPFVHPGGEVRLTFNVGNLGFAPSGDIHVDFFLLSWSMGNPWDGIYMGTRVLPALEAGTWYRIQEQTLQLPAHVLAGSSWYLAWVATSDTPEYYSGQESYCAPLCNNIGRIRDQLLHVLAPAELPDLRFEAGTGPSGPVARGRPFLLQAVVGNAGGQLSQPGLLYAFLGAGGQCEVPIATAGEAWYVEILPTGSLAVELHATVPTDQPEGPALICLLVDAGDSTQESDEGNNVLGLQIQVQDPPVRVFGDSFE